MSVLKKIISTVLLIATLVLALASCDGKSDEPVQNNGKISENFLVKNSVTFWEGDNGAQGGDLNGSLSFDELTSKLTSGGRIWWFGVQPPKYSEELAVEDFKRVKFTIEADRSVTVYISAGLGELGVVGATRYDLEANKATEIEVEGLAYEGSFDYAVVISPTENGIKGEYNYKTEAFKEWYQTNYKITDLEFYTK